MALTYSVQIRQADDAQVEAKVRQALIKLAVSKQNTADAAEKVAVGKIVGEPRAWGRRAYFLSVTDSAATATPSDAELDTVIAAQWPAIVLAAQVVD